ncbi:hypothetical protein [Pseudomonas frederiksbergensis]|uniref:hypothetical protein n=1 Tax=Pseudomonas frederiksbergensis TaxID=104087 RepID=UPI0012EB32E6|nr:hypothetical protein [Pseudomonas frederiksbergensis]
MFRRFFRQRNAVAERLSGVRIGSSISGTVRSSVFAGRGGGKGVSRVFWRSVEN